MVQPPPQTQPTIKKFKLVMSQAGYNLHVYVPLDAFQANEGRFLSGRGKYSGITSHYGEGSPHLEHF